MQRPYTPETITAYNSLPIPNTMGLVQPEPYQVDNVSEAERQYRAIARLVHLYNSNPTGFGVEYGLQLKQIAEPLGMPVYVPSSAARGAFFTAMSTIDAALMGIPGLLGIAPQPRNYQEESVKNAINTIGTLAWLAFGVPKLFGLIKGGKAVASAKNVGKLLKPKEVERVLTNKSILEKVPLLGGKLEKSRMNTFITDQAKRAMIQQEVRAVEAALKNAQAAGDTKQAARFQQYLDYLKQQYAPHLDKDLVSKPWRQLRASVSPETRKEMLSQFKTAKVEMQQQFNAQLPDELAQISKEKFDYLRNTKLYPQRADDIFNKIAADQIEERGGKFIVKTYTPNNKGQLVATEHSYATKEMATKAYQDNLSTTAKVSLEQTIKQEGVKLRDDLNVLKYNQGTGQLVNINDDAFKSEVVNKVAERITQIQQKYKSINEKFNQRISRPYIYRSKNKKATVQGLLDIYDEVAGELKQFGYSDDTVKQIIESALKQAASAKT